MLHQILIKRLEKVEIVPLEIDMPKSGNPLLKWSGAFKDDPYFDEMLADIAELRRERNAQMAEYYSKLDREDAAKNIEVEETAK